MDDLCDIYLSMWLERCHIYLSINRQATRGLFCSLQIRYVICSLGSWRYQAGMMQYSTARSTVVRTQVLHCKRKGCGHTSLGIPEPGVQGRGVCPRTHGYAGKVVGWTPHSVKEEHSLKEGSYVEECCALGIQVCYIICHMKPATVQGVLL
jgi:hypothetical protein